MNSKRVGVIGGGQLAWMMGGEASNLGLELIVQTPNQTDPATSVAAQVVLAQIDDAQATAKLATLADVITFENEFINLEALKKLEQQGVCFRPSLAALAPLLDKYQQRSFLQSIGIPVPKFSLCSASSNLADDYDFPLVLKARRHGYDGQGTFIIKDAHALEDLSQRLPLDELLVEEFVSFEKELGIIAARNVAGEIAIYPVTQTYQKNQVCHWTITPADVSQTVEQEISAIARTILSKLEVIGVFGIEFFLTSNNQVLVNEIAPRTHNSGHYTLDGCHTSQFAMQLMAVADLPLKSTALKSAGALMVNLLGYEKSESDYLEKRHHILTIPNSFVHWYGKSSRPGRKLGHVTVVLDEQQLPLNRSIIEQIEAIWYA